MQGDRRLFDDATDFVIESLAAHGLTGTKREDVGINTIVTSEKLNDPIITLGVFNDVASPSCLPLPEIIALPDHPSTQKRQIKLAREESGKKITVHTIIPRAKTDAEATRDQILSTGSAFNLEDSKQKILHLSCNRLRYSYSRLGGERMLTRRLEQLKKMAAAQGYKVVITTGPKTLESEEFILREVFPPKDFPHSFYWKTPSTPYLNPYPYFLQKADMVVVAGGTLSVLSDPINWGKPTLCLDLGSSNGYLAQKIQRNEFDRTFRRQMINAGQLHRLNAQTKFADTPPADPEKTGWPEVGRQLAETVRQKLNDPAVAARFSHIKDGHAPQAPASCHEKARQAALAPRLI